jgi:hypothetical protein
MLSANDFFYAIAKATPDDFSSLSKVLSPELIDTCLEQTGVAKLRKRRLPLDMVVWVVVGIGIGMAMFRHISMGQIVNHLDIMLPGKRPFVAPSAVVQARCQWPSEVTHHKKCQSALTDWH